MSDFFLWGGFIFSLFWHVYWWLPQEALHKGFDQRRFNKDQETSLEEMSDVQRLAFKDRVRTRLALEFLNLGLSGIALCVFGYLAFQTVP